MTDEFVAITIPAVGVAMTEAAILRWLVGIGDVVAEGQHVAEVETDKVVMELESPAAGVITEILVEPGVNIEVNVPVATIKLGGAVAQNPADPPLQDAVVVHNPAVEEPSPVPAAPSESAPVSATVSEARSVASDQTLAESAPSGRAPFPSPPRVRFADRHALTSNHSVEASAGRDPGQSTAPHNNAARPWVTMSEMSAIGLERSLADLRRNRSSASVTYTDLLISALARAAVHTFVDRTIITSVAVAAARSLHYLEISDASSLSPEAISRSRPRTSTSPPRDSVADSLELIIVNAGPDGGDVVLPPGSTPPDAIVVGVGSIAPRVVALGGGVSVQATVHVSVSAPLEDVTPQQLSRFVSTIREKLSHS